MTGTNLVEMARLAETFGDGEIRLTTDQNLILTGVPEENLSGLLAEPLLQTHSPNPKPFEQGSGLHRQRVLPPRHRRDQGAGPAVGTELDRRVTIEGADIIRLHFSGCSASCAQPQIADVGFRGRQPRPPTPSSKGSTSG